MSVGGLETSTGYRGWHGSENCMDLYYPKVPALHSVVRYRALPEGQTVPCMYQREEDIQLTWTACLVMIFICILTQCLWIWASRSKECTLKKTGSRLGVQESGARSMGKPSAFEGFSTLLRLSCLLLHFLNCSSLPSTYNRMFSPFPFHLRSKGAHSC